MKASKNNSRLHFTFLFMWLAILSFFFAKLEIQIEGSAGWAANLPTWKIEKHWLLDIFWGGRPMTGYHAWAFSFMFLVFHLGFFLWGTWNWQLEARVIAALMWFWIMEDFLWFVLNPAYGIYKFSPKYIPWHKHWLYFLPTDYVVFLVAGAILFWISFRFSK